MGLEHRREPRHPFFAAVELLELEHATRIQARTGNLSLHGCYVDTQRVFPVASQVKVVITHDNTTFTALGAVAHSSPSAGMGIRFTAIDPPERAVLMKWLSALHA